MISTKKKNLKNIKSFIFNKFFSFPTLKNRMGNVGILCMGIDIVNLDSMDMCR